MRFLLKKPMAQILEGIVLSGVSRAWKAKKNPNHTCSHLHIESLRRRFRRRMETSDEEGLGRRMVSGEEEGPAGREGFYSTVW